MGAHLTELRNVHIYLKLAFWICGSLEVSWQIAGGRTISKHFERSADECEFFFRIRFPEMAFNKRPLVSMASAFFSGSTDGFFQIFTNSEKRSDFEMYEGRPSGLFRKPCTSWRIPKTSSSSWCANSRATVLKRNNDFRGVTFLSKPLFIQAVWDSTPFLTPNQLVNKRLRFWKILFCTLASLIVVTSVFNINQ